MLFIGEKVGSGGPAFDIALDPLEGTTITAKGGQNAMAVIAMAEEGHFLNAPDTYMNKIAVGGGLPDDLVALEEYPATNLKNLATAEKVDRNSVLQGKSESVGVAHGGRHISRKKTKNKSQQRE